MKASNALRLRKQRSINYYRMPLDWWERQKRLPDLNKEELIQLKKKDYLESIRLFRREIFKTPEQQFWKFSPSPFLEQMPVVQPKLILAPSVLKFMRQNKISKKNLDLEDEILIPTDIELQFEFQKYDRLVSNFYKETSNRFAIYEEIISYLWIGHLPLLKAKNTSYWKKNLNKLRKRRTLKATKAQRKVSIRKSFKEMTSKRFALQKINHLRYNGFRVTMNTFLERERNFLDEGVPYTTKIQCTPNRVYRMKLEFTNR